MERIKHIIYMFILFVALGAFAQSERAFAGLPIGLPTGSLSDIVALGPADKAEYTILYFIDARTGAVAEIGDTGFPNCGAMDFSPDGTLFATCGRPDGSDTPVLITIDTSDGAGTEVGPTGIPGRISDISFNSEGSLFAYEEEIDPEHTVYKIDTTTGMATS